MWVNGTTEQCELEDYVYLFGGGRQFSKRNILQFSWMGCKFYVRNGKSIFIPNKTGFGSQNNWIGNENENELSYR